MFQMLLLTYLLNRDEKWLSKSAGVYSVLLLWICVQNSLAVDLSIKTVHTYLYKKNFLVDAPFPLQAESCQIRVNYSKRQEKGH